MMGKLYNSFATLAVATLLASGGFVGYLLGTGHLSKARLELIADVLGGRLDNLPPGAVDATAATAAASQPTSAPAGTSADEARGRRQREDLESLRLERAQADLAAQRRLLDQVLQEVVQTQERLKDERASFATQQKQSKAAVQDEGFQKELDYVSNLKPAQAKEHLLRVWQRQKPDAVRLLVAMEEGRGRRILEQFKTPEELRIMTDLLEQVRLQGLDARASGKTDGVAAP